MSTIRFWDKEIGVEIRTPSPFAQMGRWGWLTDLQYDDGNVSGPTRWLARVTSGSRGIDRPNPPVEGNEPVKGSFFCCHAEMVRVRLHSAAAA
jgi:hypothetical protein